MQTDPESTKIHPIQLSSINPMKPAMKKYARDARYSILCLRVLIVHRKNLAPGISPGARNDPSILNLAVAGDRPQLTRQEVVGRPGAAYRYFAVL
jgi:hypothetical protein